MEISIEKTEEDKKSILKELPQMAEQLKERFDDVANRQKIVKLLRENIGQIEKLTRTEEEKYYCNSCIIIHDALKKANVEEMTMQQANVLSVVISKLQGPINKDDSIEIDNILFENNMDWMFGNQ